MKPTPTPIPTTSNRSTEVRAKFAVALAEKRALRTGYEDPEIRRLHTAYVDDLRATLRKLSPRARVKREPAYEQYPSLEANELHRRLEKLGPVGAALGNEVLERHKPPLHARAEAIHDEHQRLDALLRELAPLAELRRAGPEGDWHYLDSRSAGDYRSQGYSALHYAEGSVQLTADVARLEGFIDGVDLVVLTARHYDDVVVAAVRVEDEVDVEIIRRCPPPSLREQVRLCWLRGVNPRVFCPWLPHGYEAMEGLDYFGRDLRAASPKPA